MSYGAITFGSNQNDASSLGTLINRGTLEATGGGSLRLDGRWSNAGKIPQRADSKAYLNGTFSTAALGTITADGGKVVLDGTLINTGSSLALGFATGSWDVAQGTIKGGTVRVSDGAGLTGGTLTLDGVTVDGDLDRTSGQYGGANLTILHGLTLNGTLTAGAGAVSSATGPPIKRSQVWLRSPEETSSTITAPVAC